MFRRPRKSIDSKKSQQSFRNYFDVESSVKSQTFLRNRTLVGSTSQVISSANENRADIQSPRAHLHHLNLKRRKLLIALLYVILSLAIMIWLTYEYTGRIKVTASFGLQTSNQFQKNKDKYSRFINDYLNAHPLERLRLVLRGDELLKYMTAYTPEVERINVTQSTEPASSAFDINFRHPVASWLVDSKQYYVDKDGVAFEVNYFEPPRVKILDKNNTTEGGGNTVASIRFLGFVGRTVETSRALGLIVEQVIIPQGTTRQLELLIKDKRFPVKMSLDRPVGEQVEDMLKAITYLEAQQFTPKYVDVRVSGKAFYK